MELHLRVLCEAWIVLAPQPLTMGVIGYAGLLDGSVLEVFSVEITLCSVSSSAPPKMMSKCSPGGRGGAKFSVSLQGVGTMRRSMEWGYLTHTFQPLALLVLQGACQKAHWLFWDSAGATTAPFPTLTPLWSQHDRRHSAALPAFLCSCLQSHWDQAVHKGYTATGSKCSRRPARAWHRDSSIVCAKRKVLSLSSPLPRFPQP